MRSPVAVPAVVLMTLLGLVVPSAAATGAELPVGSVDLATGSPSQSHLEVTGWALDPGSPTAPTSVKVVVNGNVFTRQADLPRPDVNAALGVSGSHGFFISVPLPDPKNEICIFATSLTGGPDRSLLCFARTGGIDRHAIGSLDSVSTSPEGADVTVAGWTLDPEWPAYSTQVHVYLNGVGRAQSASEPRPDVNAAFGATNGHGFRMTLPLPPGNNEICVFAISVAETGNQPLGCRTVEGRGKRPARGALDVVVATTDGSQARVAGWTVDPDSPSASTDVHIYVNGRGYARTANGDRADVNSVLSVEGRHGFIETVPLADGANTVCAYAISTSGGGNSSLGCRTVDGPPPVRPVLGALDSVTVSPNGTQARIAGWAVDLNAPETSAASLLVADDWDLNNPLRFAADRPRPDVNAAIGVAGDHGFVITVPLNKERTNLCAYIGSRRADAPNPGLWCQDVPGPPEPTEAPVVTGVTTSADASGRFATVTGRHLSGYALRVELFDATTGEFQWENSVQPLHTEAELRITIGSQMKPGTYRLVIGTSAGEVTSTLRLVG